MSSDPSNAKRTTIPSDRNNRKTVEDRVARSNNDGGVFAVLKSFYIRGGDRQREGVEKVVQSRGNDAPCRAMGWRRAEVALTISIRARSLHDFLRLVAACVGSRRKVVAMKRKLMEIAMVAVKTRRAAGCCSRGSSRSCFCDCQMRKNSRGGKERKKSER